MKQRIIVATLLLAIVLPGFLFPPLMFLSVGFLVALGLAAVHELATMFRPHGTHVARRVAGATLVVLVLAALRGRSDLFGLLLGLSVCAAFLWRMTRDDIANAWTDVAATVGAGVYIGLPTALLAGLFVGSGESRLWLLLLLLVVWSTDSIAYFSGKTFGTAKIFPRLSPGKTWEGCLGGVAGSMLPAPVLLALFPSVFGGVAAFELVLVCLVTGLFVQAGDLAESLLKRAAGVKDSGTLLASHGGALDRLDSLLFAAIPFCLYLQTARPAAFL